jgi:coronin-7
MRQREYALWDSRNLSKPLERSQLDSSTGLLIPLYDEDTDIVFLAGKVNVWRL